VWGEVSFSKWGRVHTLIGGRVCRDISRTLKLGGIEKCKGDVNILKALIYIINIKNHYNRNN